MSDEPVQPAPDEPHGRFGDASKSRMAELVAMAMAYRNWSQRELAEFLGRDVHNIIPGSGVPKVDLVVRLAEALDWPAAAVLEDICGERRATKRATEPAGDFRTLNRAAFDASAAGRHEDAVSLAMRAARVASTADELSECDKRECVAWDGLGRFQNAIEAAQRGLRRPGTSRVLQADLRANLASCYFALGLIHEGEGVAAALLGEMESLSLGELHETCMRAHLLFVRAQCRSARIEADPAGATDLAKGARADFEQSASLWERFAASCKIDSFRGRAHACRAGVIAMDVVLGALDATTALETIASELGSAVDLREVPRGDWLESYGWWCIFGAQISLRGGTDRQTRDRHLAIFTNKAYEIAELSRNWSLRERAFTIDYICGRGEPSPSGSVFDADDVRILAGAMGRFPAFRAAGWELFRRSTRI